MLRFDLSYFPAAVCNDYKLYAAQIMQKLIKEYYSIVNFFLGTSQLRFNEIQEKHNLVWITSAKKVVFSAGIHSSALAAVLQKLGTDFDILLEGWYMARGGIH